MRFHVGYPILTLAPRARRRTRVRRGLGRPPARPPAVVVHARELRMARAPAGRPLSRDRGPDYLRVELRSEYHPRSAALISQ